MKTNHIRIKDLQEVDILRKAGKILSLIIGQIKGSLTAGMTTKDIDTQAQALMQQYGVKPAFKGYRGFPANICVSVNEGVVHGIPNGRIIRNGDIVSVDVGIIYDDYYSDTAVTIPIGPVNPQIQKLLEVSEAALYKGIEQARAGQHLSDISYAVQSYVQMHGFSVVRDFVGHGIGRQLHEDPEIPNYGSPHQGPVLKEGMVLAIEPMVNMGGHRTKVLSDGWTVVTEDGKPSVHFEHCVLITFKEAEILTR
ncbi:MAG: type I methionyl aminopeptidase [Candidatus Omnitrophica bacterium]|nr:type I methionyl aminopeptidase [Candidatus Omnitrophota bacterium]